MRTLLKKKIIKYAIPTVGIAAITFIILMKSNYNIFLRGGHQASDGDVFRTIGWLMTEGYVPYRDIFDHKGMFLYFIQYLGTFFGTIRGIWVIEAFFWLISIIACYRITRIDNKPMTGLFIILLAFSRIGVCGYGNCCEEFSILFQLIGIYFFADFYRNPQSYLSSKDTGGIGKTNIFDFRVFLLGASFACVFFMKANFCGVWIVFCLAIATECIYRKHLSSLIKFIVSFSAGAVLITVPIFLYLIKNGALNDFIYDYFVFNSLYSSNIERVNIKTKINSIATFANTLPCILAFFIIIYKICGKYKNKKFDCIYLIYMIVSILLVTMSGQTYPKMEMAILPAYIYPLSQLFVILKEEGPSKSKVIPVVLGYLIITCIVPDWGKQINDVATDINRYVNTPENRGMYDNDIVQFIKETTMEEDSIAVVGNKCVYYLYSERKPFSKYIFLPDLKVKPSIFEEYMDELEREKPKVIVVVTEYKGDFKYATNRLNKFLKDNGYEKMLDEEQGVYLLKSR